jgi:hypothetical protein
MKLPIGVNSSNIFRAAFLAISFQQKIQAQSESAKIAGYIFIQKVARKILIKLTPC